MDKASKSKKNPGSPRSIRLPRWLWAVVLTAIILMGAAGLLTMDWFSGIPVDQQATYVGRESCIQCHQQQASLFHGSHHDLAMDAATPASVLAAFDGTVIEHYGIQSKVFERDGKYWVNTDGPDGKMADFEVKYVFGVSPLQQYMVELEPPPAAAEPGSIGRVQVLRLSWDTAQKKWFYLSPPDVDEKLDADDPLHWTGITQCWNSSCADCHSTNLKKNFDVQDRSYATTFAEMDVSCEACHGPGSLHVEIAKNRTFFWDRHHGYGLAKLKTASNQPQIEACAKCHSRRAEIQEGFQPGKPFHDFYTHELLNEFAYFDDGQIKDEDYVYGSFLQSKMFHKGIRCTDCHDPHSTKVLQEGNQLCTSCHQHPAEKYDVPAHHQHKVGSTGASCVECHMPETTYMEVDPRRDHSIRVPRPDLSVEIGTPNACSRCHIDKEKLPLEHRAGLKQYNDWLLKAKAGDAVIAAELKRLDQWSLDAVEKWYGKKEYPLHFAQVFHEIRSGQQQSPDALRELIATAETPAIVRATAAAELIQIPGNQSLTVALQAIDDRDETVINAAIEKCSTEMLGVYYESVQEANNDSGREAKLTARAMLKRMVIALGEKLDHPSRLVRSQSARALASLPESARIELLNRDQREALQRGLDEFVAAQMVSADRERAHLIVGRMYEEMGDMPQATKYYRRAIHVEPNSTMARRSLASVLDQQLNQLMMRGQSLAAQGNREAAMSLAQQIGDLGAEIEKLRSEELDLLQREIARLGDNPNAGNVYYQLGTALYLAGDEAGAETKLAKAVELEPRAPRFLLALAYLYQKQENWTQAFEMKNRLLELDPQNQQYLELEQQLLEATKNLKSPAP
jgi:predicted CXXCH cytochrome family protein